MQTAARSQLQTADVGAHSQSRGKAIIDVAPTVTASGIHSSRPPPPSKKRVGTKKKICPFQWETHKSIVSIYTRSLIQTEAETAAAAAQ